jgi:hypothetical protein
MALNITYGQGGYCENCDNTHEHPLHNILEQTEVADTSTSDQQTAKESAQAKLKALGLTDEEIQAMIGK